MTAKNQLPQPQPQQAVDGAEAPAALPVIQPGQAGAVTAAKPDVMILPSGQPVAAPTSTEEEDRVSAGQRQVNLIWENTQMRVALSVIWSALAVAAALAIFGKHIGSPDIQLAAVVFLFGVANLVTGFYFGRTNHQKIGGVTQGR
jgi:hypothetical protein